jgi:nucleoside-diphosphate-sugar epimerase
MAIQRFLSAALSGETVTVYGDGVQTRDFTFVGDVVEAHLLALKAPADERVFNVCGGSRVSVNDLLQLVQETTGRSLRIEHVEEARGDARNTLGDNARARRAIGFKPTVALRDGLGAQWRWLCEESRSSHR